MDSLEKFVASLNEEQIKYLLKNADELLFYGELSKEFLERVELIAN
jgi:hypothetical protein